MIESYVSHHEMAMLNPRHREIAIAIVAIQELDKEILKTIMTEPSDISFKKAS